MPVLNSSGNLVPRSRIYKRTPEQKRAVIHKHIKTNAIKRKAKKNPAYMTEELAQKYTDQNIGQMLYNQFKD